MSEEATVTIDKIREAIKDMPPDMTGDTTLTAHMVLDRIMLLLKQEVAEATTSADFETRRLVAITDAARKVIDAGVSAAKLEISKDEHKRRVSETEARIAVMQQKLSGLPERIEKIKDKLEQLEGRADRGDRTDPIIIRAIWEQLVEIESDFQGYGDAA